MRMYQRKLFIRVVVVIVMISALSSCVQKFRDIRVTSCEIVSFTPRGLRSADAVLSLGVDNPAGSFVVNDFEVIIKDAGAKLCVLRADPVSFEKKSSQKYTVPCSARIESLSVMEILELVGGTDFSDFTADVSATVATGKGSGHKIKFNDIKITELIK